MIYPTEATGDDDFTFVVTAQDEEGQGRVSSNSLTVEVNDFMNPIFFFTTRSISLYFYFLSSII